MVIAGSDITNSTHHMAPAQESSSLAKIFSVTCQKTQHRVCDRRAILFASMIQIKTGVVLLHRPQRSLNCRDGP